MMSNRWSLVVPKFLVLGKRFMQKPIFFNQLTRTHNTSQDSNFCTGHLAPNEHNEQPATLSHVCTFCWARIPLSWSQPAPISLRHCFGTEDIVWVPADIVTAWELTLAPSVWDRPTLRDSNCMHAYSRATKLQPSVVWFRSQRYGFTQQQRDVGTLCWHWQLCWRWWNPG